MISVYVYTLSLKNYILQPAIKKLSLFYKLIQKSMNWLLYEYEDPFLLKKLSAVYV